MNREELLSGDSKLLGLYNGLKQLHLKLGSAFLLTLNRLPAFNDILIDRWERAQLLGFGKGTNIYDSSLVIGDVKIGNECWIGPNTILDGSGGLNIGNYCTISAGVQIYTHDNVKQTLSSKRLPIERLPVSLGNNVYIGPNAIITKGVKIGDKVIVGASAFVNKNIPDNSIVIGQPAKIIGSIEVREDEIIYHYH